MVFETGLGAMEEDVCVVIEWLKGGGTGRGSRWFWWGIRAVVGWRSGWLAQWVVEKAGAEVRVKGVALLAGMPCFGQ